MHKITFAALLLLIGLVPKTMASDFTHNFTFAINDTIPGGGNDTIPGGGNDTIPGGGNDTIPGGGTSQILDATIDTSAILYWVGTGDNKAILAVNWLDTALAWGYKWSGSATVGNMLNDIAAADTRFSVYIYSTTLNNIYYNDGSVSLSLSSMNSFWRCRINGGYGSGLSQAIADGDLVKYADYDAHVTNDSVYHDNGYGGGYWTYNEIYPTTIHPVSIPGGSVTPTYDSVSVSQTACDAFTWSVNGATYTTSGVYQYIDSTSNMRYILNLTINHGTVTYDSVVAENSYFWHNNTYTTSGTYTYSYSDSNGCSSTDILLLTISSSSDTTGPIACHITAISNNTDYGFVLGAGEYTRGSLVFLYAIPASGIAFNSWTDSSNTVLSTSNPYAFTANGNMSVRANFSQCGGASSDTVYVTRTVHDTIVIHDTIYINDNGIDSVDAINAKVYSNNGNIVIEGAEGNTVMVFEINGHVVATKQDYGAPLRFEVPATGTYLVKIGRHAARKIVVIKRD